jgi:mannan endo-1,4-beta-mannosidase
LSPEYSFDINSVNMRNNSIYVILSFIFGVYCLNAQEILLEAEEAALFGVTVSRSGSGYSGTGYVTGFDSDNDRIEFTFTASNALYEVIIGFATPYGEKGYELEVNDIKASGMFPASNSAFLEHNAGKYVLEKGQNKIIIGGGWNWYNIDYIKLSPASIELPQKPPKILSDHLAAAHARSLFSYLIDLYGEKVLSGQQDMAEIEYIYGITGKYPAVSAFDLIDYSPSRIAFGANPGGAVEKWIAWAETQKSIISLSWHWNAPTDLINQPGGQEWWRGFYTEATTFDIETVLADTNSNRYQLLLQDLDAIAAELKKFQQKDIPVLWRPLHEASGGWFWWGAKGAQPFKQLWQLMYDRYVNRHGLHNLIWVYTAGDPEWYPGDDHVDIVSLDIYTDPSSAMSGEWENIQAEFNGKKLVTLSESGTIPDPDKIRIYGVWWSWFSIWSGSFIHDIDAEYLKRVYADEDILTADELDDWYIDVQDSGQDDKSHAALSVYPNPSKGDITIKFTMTADGPVTFTLYDILGKMVKKEDIGVFPVGKYYHDFHYSNLASGVYILKFHSKENVLYRKLVLLK